ncbi:MAG TPA: hypothetical protein VJT73_05165 [Polyangiaceae bacterium]|nr:hypothetical protein [Polyangiaceae bacterium]
MRTDLDAITVWIHGSDGRDWFDVPEGEEERRERALAELVLPEMLASCMAPPVAPHEYQMSQLTAGMPAVRARTAESWRLDGGPLTGPMGDAVGRAGTTGVAGGDRANEGRLITEIDAGDLGQIRVVVERSGEGVRVMLATDNPVTAASAELQRSALEQSLRASGFGFASVTVAHGLGTVIAQSPIQPRTGASNAADPGSPPGKTSGQARRQKRLNLTG